MVEYKEGEFVNGRGQKLFCVQYLPDSKNPKAILVFCHGYGEHIGRYDAVFSQIADAGVAVHSFDQIGHGKSEPHGSDDRCYIQSVEYLVDDVYTFLEQVKLSYIQSPPMFMAGHSMGGLVATLSVLRTQNLWSGLVLHSALVDVEWTLSLRLQSKIGALLALAMPRARVVPAVRPEDMNPDPDLVKDYLNDPLNFIGPVRARTANELMKGFRKVQSHQQELTVPILAVHGTQDRCTSLTAVKRLVELAASKDKTFKEVDGGYHELLFGSGGSVHAKGISDWVTNELQKPKL